MKLGKLAESHLKRSVLKKVNKCNNLVLSRTEVGIDGAVAKADAPFVVTAQAMVTLPVVNPVRLAIIKAINNLTVAGGTVYGIQLSMTVPALANESFVRALQEEAVDTVALYDQVEILGGGVELSHSVVHPVITVVAVGTSEYEYSQKALYDIKPDMDIVMTKWAGMEATYLLATNKFEELNQAFSKPYIELAASFGEHLSVVKEANICRELGVHAMHDISTGGVYAGLWELLEPSDLGCHVTHRQIPIKQETVELAEFYNVNPYMLMGAGSLLAVTADGEALVSKLMEAGIVATVIGTTTRDKARAICIEIEEDEEFRDPAKPRRRISEEQRFLVPPRSDELYILLSKQQA